VSASQAGDQGAPPLPAPGAWADIS
jgi:hypothetical protein